MTPEDLDQKDRRRLMQVRCCTCWCEAPCLACTAPLTEGELREISELASNEEKSYRGTQYRVARTGGR